MSGDDRNPWGMGTTVLEYVPFISKICCTNQNYYWCHPLCYVHRPLNHILKVIQTMNTAQASCPGSKQVFNPCSLSQHLSKTQHAHCHIALAALQSPSIFQALHNIDSLQRSTVILPPHEDNTGSSTGILPL